MPDIGDIERHDRVPRTFASFFSGAGGGSLGLHRAEWRPVSFSEIEPYPSAILSTHWPEVPNLGDITAVDAAAVPQATLWMGGFPCQDLSLAGARRGLRTADGSLTRSGLAFTFLGLAERRRPRVILLENVAGLLSSNGGHDFLALQNLMGDIGYSVAWRLLDAQWFGVPQRRRRVFILGFDTERYPDEHLPGEVLAVGTSCPRDHQQEREAWQAAARDAGSGAFFNSTASFGHWEPGNEAGTLSQRDYKSPNHLVAYTAGGFGEYVDAEVIGSLRRSDSKTGNHLVGQEIDSDRSGAPDGLAGQVDGPERVAWSKVSRVRSDTTPETWADTGVANTINTFDVGDIRTTTIVTGDGSLDDADPKGLDSQRFKAIGNGVVAGMTEWIGRRLAGVV